MKLTRHNGSAVKNSSKKRFAFLPVCLFLLLVSCGQHRTSIRNTVNNGLADLSEVSFAHTVISLNGDWHFWPDELLEDGEVRTRLSGTGTASTGILQKVPSNWSDLRIFKDSDTLSRCGTLAVEVILPDTVHDIMIRLTNANAACRLVANGSTVAVIGEPVFDGDAYRPGKATVYTLFKPDDNRVLLILQVVNHSLPYTGTWDNLKIGTIDTMLHMQRLSLIRECLISGAILFMGLYHLFLFLLRRVDRNTLIFSLICFFMTVRTLMMGERVLMPLFADTAAGWRAAFVVEHLSVHMCLPLFYLFIKKIYPRDMPPLPFYTVLVMSGLWALLELCTPPMIHHRFLSLFECFIFVAAVYLAGIACLAAARHRSGAWITLAGILVMVLAVVNDVLFSNGIIQSVYMVSYGLCVFTFAQGIFLARRSSRLFSMVENYADELKTLNDSLERFVPREMLSYLHKKSITDVRLGDFSEETMSVFFLDIRNFTARSESMSPEETFRFINSFLEVFGPIVRAHGGFIDKYLGDGFMALFPHAPDSALAAALEMKKRLLYFNYHHFSPQNADTWEDVDFGIGIHTGALMLGTIGETRRMDSTVISDTVNTASRLEQLNKVHGTTILVSEQTIKSLRHPENFSWEEIGKEKVKGKAEPVTVFKLL